jgi:hypothetical protein
MDKRVGTGAPVPVSTPGIAPGVTFRKKWHREMQPT